MCHNYDVSALCQHNFSSPKWLKELSSRRCRCFLCTWLCVLCVIVRLSSSSCTMSVVLVAIQCQLESPSPSVSIMHKMVQFLQCSFAPVLSVVHPFSMWFSFVLSLHYSEH